MKRAEWLLGTGLLFVMLLNFAHYAKAAAFISADVVGLSTNAVATGTLDLGTTSPGGGCILFPYYLRVLFPAQNNTAWGIQMYTDNNPNDSWTATNGLYGGLRGATDPTHGIPMYWQVYNSMQNAVPAWGTAQSITTTAGGLGFYDNTLGYWGRVYDSSDADVVSTWQESVWDRTIASYRGLGDYPNTGRLSVAPPVYVYLGLNTASVTMSQDYRTTLRIDLYNLGYNITQGGYATPNPFTPTTGQRTNFNFYLQDINAGFKINIFTIRGRKIRTITDTKEWDGRNDQGQLVEGGLYIYQIEAEGKRVSGTVVLIK